MKRRKLSDVLADLETTRTMSRKTHEKALIAHNKEFGLLKELEHIIKVKIHEKEIKNAKVNKN